MDKEKVKKALDAFEKDEFTAAKEILSKEIRSKRNEKLKNKLELEADIEPVEKDDEVDDKDADDKDDKDADDDKKDEE